MTPNDRDDLSIVEMIPALRAFARTFHNNANDADDLVQETLARALKSFDTFQAGTRLKSWLFTIMRNAFYTKAKVSRRESPGAEDCVADRRTVEASQEWSVRGKEVAAALEKIPQHHREVLVLVAVLGVSYEEAAEISGCAVGTIKSRLSRARQCVLEELGEATPHSALEPSDRFTSARFEADARRQ